MTVSRGRRTVLVVRTRLAASTGIPRMVREGGDYVALLAVYDAVKSFLRRDDHGQGLAEYALILALIALLAILALIFLGGQISAQLGTIGHTLESQHP